MNTYPIGHPMIAIPLPGAVWPAIVMYLEVTDSREVRVITPSPTNEVVEIAGIVD